MDDPDWRVYRLTDTEWQHGEMTCTETSREQDPTMGKPSDHKRSAQRPGQRERKRVKRARRGQLWTHVTGVGEVHAKVGQKKWHRLYVWLNRMRRDHSASIGEAYLESRDNEGAKASLSERLGQDQPTPPVATPAALQDQPAG